MDEIWLLLGMDIQGHVICIEAFKNEPVPYKHANDDAVVAYSVMPVKVQE